MAQRVEVLLVDDLDGGEADHTITFAIDGTAYEIDLSDANAERLRSAVAPFVDAGRKIKSGKAAVRDIGPSTRRTASSSRKEYLADLRQWATANGHDVPSRGRIPQDVERAYQAAVAG